MKQYTVALFIGRFQPFHNGHLYSFNKAFELADKVIVGIGSSQESGTENNPWNYETRKKMVESLLAQAGLPGDSRKVIVVPVPDMFDDKKWGELIIEIIKNEGLSPAEVVAVGNNDWTNKIVRGVGVKVFETGLYNRDELEGIKIRELQKINDVQWKKRVPESVVKYLEEYDKQN